MDDIFRQIESGETAARLGIHSGYRQFLRALVSDPSARLLRGWLRGRPTDKYRVFARIATLSEERIDPRYEHPSDTAFSVYLTALAAADNDLFEAAREIAGAAPNLWWTRKLLETPQTAGAELSEHAPSGAGAPFSALRPTSHSIDSLIPAPTSYGNRRILPVVSSGTSDANTSLGDAKSTSTSDSSLSSLAAA